MTETNDIISGCIDNICQLGCDAVRKTITAIEKGETPEQVDSLNNEDKNYVLGELKDIMSVYDEEVKGGR